MHRRSALLSIAVFALAGCSADPDPATTRITARVASPGGQIEAVSARVKSGSSTVETIGSVYLVRPGEFPKHSDRVFSKPGACEVWVRWVGEQALVISFAGRDDSYETGTSAASPAAKVRIESRGRDEASGC